MNKAKAIMFQGTGSGVGKSLCVAAFCRILMKQGIKVAPFKAQNMALNSFVTHDGFEMGRAQVYQAQACGVLPDVRMNPILLKPTGERGSQVILMGKPAGNLSAVSYYERYEQHLQIVRKAYDSLASEYDVIVIEGAGSPAEINLQKTDIVNMQMAHYADAQVIIIGDIDRGGVFAWLKGTFELVSEADRQRIAGFLINKFRGDVSLLMPGLEMFRKIVDRPVFGVLPCFADIIVDQEDGVFVHEVSAHRSDAAIKITVIELPRISNFTDFAPLSFEKDVELAFVKRPEEIADCDCLIIPGTKNTCTDMKFLREIGWVQKICELAANNTEIVGICGGYQMLGVLIDDPFGFDNGAPEKVQGIGLLPIETVMASEKHLTQSKIPLASRFAGIDMEVVGYEIHMGVTDFAGNEAKLANFGDIMPISNDFGVEMGGMRRDMPVWGCYLHGIFDNDLFRRNFLDRLRIKKGLEAVVTPSYYQQFREQQLDKLADWMGANCDMVKLLEFLEVADKKSA